MGHFSNLVEFQLKSALYNESHGFFSLLHLADFHIGLVPDRPEPEPDRPEAGLLSQPSGMVLRSHSRTGRSEVIVSAEIHPENPGGAPRPEPEMARPEVEIAPVAGSSSDRDVVVTTGSPMIDSSGETVETLSEHRFPAQQSQSQADR